MDESFSALEKRILLKAGSLDPSADIALEQLQLAVVTKRQNTGKGIFVHFQASADVRQITESSGRILIGSQKLSLSHPRLSQGADVIIWIENGFMDCLEMCVFADEPWPTGEDDSFEFQYWPAE